MHRVGALAGDPPAGSSVWNAPRSRRVVVPSRAAAVALGVLFVPFASAQEPAIADAGAFVETYCVTCLNDTALMGGLTLGALDASNPAANPEIWEKVTRKVRVGMMPPVNAPVVRPTRRPRSSSRIGITHPTL